jgi:dihydrofolate reductase
MRKIIVSEFVTLDGVMEGPGPVDSFKFAGWTTEYSNADILKFKHHELFNADTLLLGRLTYEGFAAVWPTVEGMGDFGERMNAIEKVVVSNTLEKVVWNNSRRIGGHLKSEIEKLKKEDGKDVLVFGSGELAHTLLDLGLIDEYRLLTYPVVLGTGKKLFRPEDNLRLKLLESKQFGDVVLLRYSPTQKEETK